MNRNSYAQTVLRLFTLLLLCFFVLDVHGQASVYGHIEDIDGKNLDGANVVVFGLPGSGAFANEDGNYQIDVPTDSVITLVFTYVGMESKYKSLILEEGKTYRVDMALEPKFLDVVEIQDERERRQFIETIPVDELDFIPDPSGDPIFAALKSLGVSSSSELSTQYSVRGGNFDENLVYVNDFEIYRPLLVRSGQQEGFPFPNYNLTDRIAFSAGGFEAKYGDKLSSVLDIKYKKPKEFDASVSLSFLGAQMHLELPNKKKTGGLLLGVRYRNNQYLLNSLGTNGEYRPSFLDIQGLANFDLGKKFELEIIGNLSDNQYNFVPLDRSTSTGVVNNVVRLDVFFDGQEVSEFQTAMGGISLNHKVNGNLGLKWLASAYQAQEDENFDIIGDYFLGAVESSLGEDDFGQVAFGLGTGTFHNFARNSIDSRVINLSHRGYYDQGIHFLQWGARIQNENIEDRLNDWERLDSAGYSLPFNEDEVLINDVLKTENNINSYRYQAWVQNNWTPEYSKSSLSLSTGARINYWDLNNELVVSPRVQLSMRPQWYSSDSTLRDVILKFASGIYVQPPFYRELRNLEGEVNTDLKSQKSFHVVAGMDWQFEAFGGRDFKFATELYYKYMWDLVPYEVDNVQIRYYGENAARGYSAGIDLRLHGELVEDADSWISLSLLRTEENVDEAVLSDFFGATDEEGNLVDRGYVPRPTDKLVNFGMFFQDYFRDNRNLKVHLNFLFGTGLPFSPPENLALRNNFRIPAYRRVDIGFSALLLSNQKPRDNFLKDVESIWASLEVFNLLGISNTISYIWVKDATNTVYAFPNFLTSRRVNLRFIVRI